MDDSAAAETTSTGSGRGCFDNRWTREAFRNTSLAAAEIYFMACPSDRLPWRDVLKLSKARGQLRGGASTSLDDLFARPPPPPEGWAGLKGKRRRRATKQVWKTEEAAAAASISTAALRTEAPLPAVEPVSKQPHSPTTPLSWTMAAASSVSGSGSASGSSAARDDDAITTAAGAAMPTKRRRSDAEEIAYAAAPAPSAFSDSAVALASAAAAVVEATGRSAVELTDAARGTTAADGAPVPTPSGAAGYASISKTTRHLLGKKMTFVELKSFEQTLLHENMEMRKTCVELKSYEQSLLQKNVQMRKELDIKREAQKVSQELEIQRKAQKAMVAQENTRQKTLAKSKSQPQAVKQFSSSQRDEGTNSGKSQFFLFDLNVPATEEMET